MAAGCLRNQICGMMRNPWWPTPFVAWVMTLPRAAARQFVAPASIWLLVACLSVSSALIYELGLRSLLAVGAPFRLEWWVIAAGYCLAEVLVVHLQFRNDTHSFSLSEIPFVVGMFFLTPTALLVALLVGSGAALALHRRQPPVKLLFNLANLAFASGIGLLIFRTLLRLGEPLGPAGWLGASAAAVASDLTSLVMIGAVVRLATGRPTELIKLLGSGSLAAFFNTCLALVTVTVLWVQPQAGWLPLVLAGLMLAAYRIYGSVRQKHESLEVLYESARGLHDIGDAPSVIETVLRQTRELFRAERAEILLFETDTSAAMRYTLEGSSGVTQTSVSELEPREGIWARVAAEGTGIALARPVANPRLRAYFATQGIRDLAIAPLFAREQVTGTLLVANRQGALSFAPQDARLLETFANHAGASLDNANLVSSLRKHAADSRHQALHDALTKLPNRVMFRQQIELAIRRSDGPGFAVVLMDLNGFKEVNDSLGHHNGDLLLEAVAGRLSGTLRTGDVVARLGGDEFGLLLANVPNDRVASALAARLTEGLAAPFEVQELTLEIGASLGLALYPAHGRDADILIQRADVAMYEAKASFQDHAVYDPERDSYSPRKLLLVGELRRAIEDGQLWVAYQPKVEVATGKIVGAEALVRWKHPVRGNVPADEFMPIVEHTGLLKPLTHFVLKAALEECAKWRASGRDLHVAVNLSVRNLLDGGLPDAVSSLLSDLHLPPHALELEVTESALIADPVRSHHVLHRLRDLGIGIAIDDYGTGYSSLAYIRRMPVNELKIDKSFVIGMARDENDKLIVRSTIDLAHNLGLRVVAEGVENRAAWRQLAQLNCDVAQGFHFGRPGSAAAFGALLARRDRLAVAPDRPLIPARRSELHVVRTASGRPAV
jgi:diguanylate cyclase (GGDEF)-like protein